MDGPCERLLGSCTVCPFLFSKMYSCHNYDLQMLSVWVIHQPTHQLLLFVPYTSVLLLVFTLECYYFFFNGNNPLTNMVLKKSLVTHFVSCRPFCPFCHPNPSLTLGRRSSLPQKREVEKELQRSDSELSAFEFQNRFLRLTVKVIL